MEGIGCSRGQYTGLGPLLGRFLILDVDFGLSFHTSRAIEIGVRFSEDYVEVVNRGENWSRISC
jgi:hypothetical protein